VAVCKTAYGSSNLSEGSKKQKEMTKERNENGKKVFKGTFESGRVLARPQPKELAIEKLIKKLIKSKKQKL
jgi:hypothetical protein